MERIDIGYEKNDFDWFIYDVPLLRKMEHHTATSGEKLQYQPDKLA
ncbi:hypothetical protein QMA09_12605 [Planococcus sp. APC 3906]|nr:hypothetical protein [Planococcus sp. APC 3906]MDN3451031.1 hypothetical protein [Planococcus sp. APC 3906]